MAHTENSKQTSNYREFLPRDILSHPPMHSPDINTQDGYYLRQVELTQMDHPATFVDISERIHERDIQPITRH